MWNFLLGFLFARATGIARFVRPLLALGLVGALIVGLIHALVVYQAVSQRNRASHVHASHT
jgi:hypothetical protein